MCGRTPAWNSGNEESPDNLCRKYLPGADAVSHRDDPVPNIRLFLCAVVLSEGQISQIHISWKNSMKICYKAYK